MRLKRDLCILFRYPLSLHNNLKLMSSCTGASYCFRDRRSYGSSSRCNHQHSSALCRYSSSCWHERRHTSTLGCCGMGLQWMDWRDLGPPFSPSAVRPILAFSLFLHSWPCMEGIRSSMCRKAMDKLACGCSSRCDRMHSTRLPTFFRKYINY